MNGYIDASVAPARATQQIKIYGPDAFEGMRKAGRLAAECLDMLVPYVVPGVTTGDGLPIHFFVADRRNDRLRRFGAPPLTKTN